MKKVLAIFVSVLFLASLSLAAVGCSKQEEPAPAPAVEAPAAPAAEAPAAPAAPAAEAPAAPAPAPAK